MSIRARLSDALSGGKRLADLRHRLEWRVHRRMAGSTTPAQDRLFATVRPFTMASYLRLHNVWDLATRAVTDGVPGAFVECGVWRGGCLGVMAGVAKESGGRPIWGFDSFEGLPEPGERDCSDAVAYAGGRGSGELSTIGRCVAPIDDVRRLPFDELGVPESDVQLVKGWFQDTLPERAADVGPIAVLRLDGDWYESTRVCLDHLFDVVQPGGFVILDDYGHWTGCREATDEFLAERGLRVELHRIDYTGTWFRKL